MRKFMSRAQAPKRNPVRWGKPYSGTSRKIRKEACAVVLEDGSKLFAKDDAVKVQRTGQPGPRCGFHDAIAHREAKRLASAERTAARREATAARRLAREAVYS